MRGRGRSIVAADEIAAEIEAQAALLDLNQTAATLIADTVSRYWEAAAARQSLEVATQAEERGQVFLDHVRTLIDADRLPRAELQQVLANVAGRAANRAAAEQRLIEATQALALATGTELEELKRNLDPADALPDAETASFQSMDTAAVNGWVSRSLLRRADYLSLRKTHGSLEVRRQAAADRLKPRLDLQFYTGYTGLKEGRRPDRQISSLFTRIGGVYMSAGFEYVLPLRNSAARGQLEQATAMARRKQFTAEDLARSIGSEILPALAHFGRRSSACSRCAPRWTPRNPPSMGSAKSSVSAWARWSTCSPLRIA